MSWQTLETSFAAFLTPCIALLTGFIAYQQWRMAKRTQETNEMRLKHELYDKRFAVYNAARTFLRKVMEKGNEIRKDKDAVHEYFFGINPARFILNQDISVFLEGIEREVFLHDEGTWGAWAEEQVGILNEKFKTFLCLKNQENEKGRSKNLQ